MFRAFLLMHWLLLTIAGGGPCCCAAARVYGLMVSFTAGADDSSMDCCCSFDFGGSGENPCTPHHQESCECVKEYRTSDRVEFVADSANSQKLLDHVLALHNGSLMIEPVIEAGTTCALDSAPDHLGLTGRALRILNCSWRC